MEINMEIFDVIDFHGLLEVLGGDHDAMSSLLQQVSEVLPTRLAELQSAADRADTAGVQSVAHAIKGILASVRAEEARCLAETVEEAAHRHDAARVGAMLPDLQKAVGRLLLAVRRWRDGQ